MGQLQAAIANYHACLSLRPDDGFASDMLSVAVEDYACTADF